MGLNLPNVTRGKNPPRGPAMAGVCLCFLTERGNLNSNEIGLMIASNYQGGTTTRKSILLIAGEARIGALSGGGFI